MRIQVDFYPDDDKKTTKVELTLYRDCPISGKPTIRVGSAWAYVSNELLGTDRGAGLHMALSVCVDQGLEVAPSSAEKRMLVQVRDLFGLIEPKAP